MTPGLFAKVLIVLTGVYVGSYIALMRPEEFSFCCLGATTSIPVTRVPYYRAQNAFCQKAFHPIAWLDQKMRPRYWQYDRKIGSGFAGGGEFGFGGHSPSFEMEDAEQQAEANGQGPGFKFAKHDEVDR